MARITAGIFTSHVPAIGAALDVIEKKHRQDTDDQETRRRSGIEEQIFLGSGGSHRATLEQLKERAGNADKG